VHYRVCFIGQNPTITLFLESNDEVIPILETKGSFHKETVLPLRGKFNLLANRLFEILCD
jgi:hypothetical protein